MISVRVSIDDIDCTVDFDSDVYSGEIIDDLCKRAAGTVIAVAAVRAQVQA